ncbi:VOC family protein [Paenibacillus sp. FSL H3-0333]|uniref:VOC family protein n=1 Tax=Paenibacillus sp. FSL H3-0333 TaxID=2921373 RepID=UPI0030FB5231
MKLQMNPYILVDGSAREAIAFYQEALGAVVLFKQTMGEGPQNPDAPMTEQEKAQIAHAVLLAGETKFFVADYEPGMPRSRGNSINICLTVETEAEAQQLFTSLKAGGTVDIELAPAYYSPAYGMVTDKFGVCFQIFTMKGR